MTELIVRENNLPTTLEDLSKFVLIGRDKLQAVRAEISALQKLNVAEEVLAQKKDEQAQIAAVVLLAEMKCGELLNKMPKQSGARTDLQPLRPAPKMLDSDLAIEPPKPKLEVAKDLGFSKDQVSQFQTLADNPEIVRQTIAEAIDKGEVPTRAAALDNIKRQKVEFNGGNNERYTPEDIIEDARRVLGTIDLDPASSELANQTVRAKKFFTAEDDGLVQEWYGNIWLNPPYSKDLLARFADKLADSHFNQAIVLVINSTDTKWFATLISKASAVVFPTGRIVCKTPVGETGNSPIQGSALIYCGNNPQKFLDVFEKRGWGTCL